MLNDEKKSDRIDTEAARWVLRIESGLSVDEEKGFAVWLASDPRHELALEAHEETWARFAPLAEESVKWTPLTGPGDRKSK